MCPDNAFEDVRIGDTEYRQCILKDLCENYVYEEIVVDDEVQIYIHCLQSFPKERTTNAIAHDDLRVDQDGDENDSCARKNPRYPVLYDGVCVSCKEANPDLPYWNTTACVAKMPLMGIYASGVVFIMLAFVGISVLKFW